MRRSLRGFNVNLFVILKIKCLQSAFKDQNCTFICIKTLSYVDYSILKPHLNITYLYKKSQSYSESIYLHKIINLLSYKPNI